MTKPIVAAVASGSVVLAVSSTVLFAHEGASGVVKERMDLMKGIGKSTKALARMFKGEVA